MAELDAGHGRRPERVLRQLDHMVASGRVTEAEADQLRAAATPADMDAAVRAISTRHAAERIDAAAAAGRLTRDEADDLLRRLRSGEDLRSLRSVLDRVARHGAQRDDVAITEDGR